MPTVATKTLNTFRKGGVTYTRKPTPISYDEALALQDDPRLVVRITQAEHQAHFTQSARIAEPDQTDQDAGDGTVPDSTEEDDDLTGEEPTDLTERLAAIVEASAQLDLDNEAHYTKAGLPDARALSQILGWTVTADERNQAFGAKKEDEVPEGGEKPKGKIVIKKKSDEPLDTGADLVSQAAEGEGGADPSTEGAVEV